MAWVTPVTSRNATARMTYLDMNRISGNVSYLYNYAKDHGYDVQGDDVMKTQWTQNDIVAEDTWGSIESVLSAVRASVGLSETSGNPSFYYSMNSFERTTLDTWRHVVVPEEYELLQNKEAVQLRTNSGEDIEAGILDA